MADLETSTTNELFTELAKRYDCIVVVASGVLKTTKDFSEHTLWYNGTYMAALGLCHYAEHRMLFKPPDEETT